MNFIGSLRGTDLWGDKEIAARRFCSARRQQVPLSLSSRRILRGFGGPSGTSHHGTREAEECYCYRAPSSAEVSVSLLSGPHCWYVQTLIKVVLVICFLFPGFERIQIILSDLLKTIRVLLTLILIGLVCDFNSI